MGEPGKQLRRARESAIAALDDYFINEHQAIRLNASPIAPRFGRFSGGWKIVLEASGSRFDLVVVVRNVFPFEAPELHFCDQSLFLRFPHVDEKGKVCLTNAIATFSPNRPVETARFLINETRKLIDDSLAGTNKDDFVDEFLSYWNRMPNFTTKKFWSLLNPSGSTRCVRYYSAVGFTLFGDSESEMRKWLKNYNGGTLPKGFYTKVTVLICLREPLIPDRYPRTAHNVFSLARESSENADALFEEAIPVNPGTLPLIFKFDTKQGPAFAGVEIPEPTITNQKNGISNRNFRNDGFRQGKIPPDILRSRYFGESKLAFAAVTRVDPAWCFQRGGVSHEPELLSKRVVMVGCGALGAEIVSLLAKSGIGQFVLIDNENLTWDNVARHLLGGDHSGQAKAPAVATHLARQMPWLDISIETRKMEWILSESPKVLQECDLIISTTGDWSSDCILNAAKRTFARFPPLLFGWTEPFGIAGHALSIFEQGGCLACGMNEFGVFDQRVTNWPANRQTMVQVNGCSDFFQPYGITDVAPIKAVIAELAIEILRGTVQEGTLRTWLGDITRLEALGGKLQDGWHDKVALGQCQRRMCFQPWLVTSKCPLCN